MALDTIIGGASVTLSLDTRELDLAQKALFAAGQGFGTGQVLTSLTDTATNGVLNVYNIADPTGTFVLPTGGEVLAVYGNGNATLIGHLGQELLIGNAGNDTINAAGGSGTIIAGPGYDQILLNNAGVGGGDQFIVTGPKGAEIDMWGGAVTIAAATVPGSGDHVVLNSGKNSVDASHSIGVDVLGGTNEVTLHDGGELFITGASTDAITTGSMGKTSIFLGHTGKVNLDLTASAGDTVVVELGQNAITSGGHETFQIVGGMNYIKLAGGDKADVYDGVSTLVVRTAGTQITEFGGSTKVDMNFGQKTSITALGGSDRVHMAGFDTVAITGGQSAITAVGVDNLVLLSGGGKDTIKGNARVDVTDKQTYRLEVNGNDTISFGKGGDTIITSGTATIHSGPSGVTVTSGLGTASMSAGSGHSTLVGGSGDDTFTGGSGHTSMVGGTGPDTMIGGSGHDTMVAGAGGDLFAFKEGDAGGKHLIEGFTHGQDFIKLEGYGSLTAAEVLANDTKVMGGNTVISLDSGHTKIVLEGFTGLQTSDFH